MRGSAITTFEKYPNAAETEQSATGEIDTDFSKEDPVVYSGVADSVNEGTKVWSGRYPMRGVVPIDRSALTKFDPSETKGN